jgi:uncharacterized protein YndB with AHSA1/START domain
MAKKTLTFKRTIEAPVAHVYRAFTNSQAWREWFCDWAMVQPREGGVLHLVWHSGNYLSGKFVELTPAKKVVLNLRAEGDTDRSQASITIDGKNGTTQLTLADTSDGAIWLKLAKEVEQGWNDALDNLKSVLETGIDQRLVRLPRLGIDIADVNDKGAKLLGVEAGTGAQAAGLQKGDVLHTLNDAKLVTWNAFTQELRKYKAGDKVKVSYSRNGTKKTVSVQLSPRPIKEVPATPEALGEVVSKAYVEINKDLAQILRGVSDEKGGRPPKPGEWSAKHILAHLIAGERDIHSWITLMVASLEAWQQEWEGNMKLRLDAVINAYPTLQALLQEFKRNQAETVALLNALPDEFVAQRGSYHRLAETLVDWTGHTREHLDQIKAAVKF